MATRCNIHFNHGDRIDSNIYRHSDGYPEGVIPDLETFFTELKAEVPDSRMGQAEHLAAKFLVWQAQQLTEYGRIHKPYKGPRDEEGYGPEHPLQFLGVAPCIQDHCDIEYIYTVDCDQHDDRGFPIVSVEEL